MKGTLDDLLLFLAAQPDERADIAELPKRFHDPNLLTVAASKGLVEFCRRRYCYVAGEVRMERGWEPQKWLGPPDESKPLAQILKEQLSISDERLRAHVRLGGHGRVRVAELRMELMAEAPSHRSPAMSRTMLAQRILRNPAARPRDVKDWKQYDLQPVPGTKHKYTVRTDQMDDGMRARVEAPLK